MDDNTLSLLLPEVKEKIFFYCDNLALLNLACCNRLCYEEIIPLLWRSVKVQWMMIEKGVDFQKPLLKFVKSLHIYESFLDLNSVKENVRVVNYEKFLKECNCLSLNSLKVDGYIVHNGLEVAAVYLPDVQNIALRFIDLFCNVDWTCLSSFKKLTSLSLFACSISDDQIKSLISIDILSTLQLVQCYQLSATGLNHVSRIPHLKKLTISNLQTDVDNRDISRKLRYFRCMYRRYISSEDYIHTLGGVKLTTNLVKLNVSGTEVNDEYFVLVSGAMKHISVLNVSKCQRLTDYGLSFIAKLGTLKNLDCSFCTYITNTGLFHISKLGLLGCLSISGCYNISDNGLQHLTRLKYLRFLNMKLSYNITENGISRLKSGIPHYLKVLYE